MNAFIMYLTMKYILINYFFIFFKLTEYIKLFYVTKFAMSS